MTKGNSKDQEVPKKKSKKTWSSSSRDENGYNKRIEVRELDGGGFLISTNEYGDKNGKYIDETKEFFSPKNPLDGQDSDQDKDEKLSSLFEPKFKQLLS